MRNTTFAIYNGTEYSAAIKSDNSVVLRSTDIRDKKKGFFRKKNVRDKIYIKYVQRDEIDEIYDKRLFAKYNGFDFRVIDETAQQISIVAMTGDYRNWINMGMQCIEKGVYQKWIDKSEAEIRIIKEQL